MCASVRWSEYVSIPVFSRDGGKTRARDIRRYLIDLPETASGIYELIDPRPFVPDAIVSCKHLYKSVYTAIRFKQSLFPVDMSAAIMTVRWSICDPQDRSSIRRLLPSASELLRVARAPKKGKVVIYPIAQDRWSLKRFTPTWSTTVTAIKMCIILLLVLWATS